MIATHYQRLLLVTTLLILGVLDPVATGTVISTSQTLYVYAETATTPNCTSENAFDVTINYTPVADAPADVTACDSYTLPALAVGTTLAHQTVLEQLQQEQ